MRFTNSGPFSGSESPGLLNAMVHLFSTFAQTGIFYDTDDSLMIDSQIFNDIISNVISAIYSIYLIDKNVSM